MLVNSPPCQALELPWRTLPGYHCFGCCEANPAGLALRFKVEGDALVCAFQTDRRHESYPGVIHGGIGVTLLDELMGNALALREHKLCFTVGMRTRFLAPLRTHQPYHALARVVERPAQEEGLFKVEGEVLDDQRHPVLMATATYQWMTRSQAKTFFSHDPAGSPELLRYFRRDP